jgi:hypothetical protein
MTTTMSNRLWVLGAADPEMAAIEKLLLECGESFAYAIGPDGQRVHSGNAYRAIGAVTPAGEFRDGFTGTQLVCVECAVALRADHNPAPIVIDHHRPGDPGYGRPPEEFLAASSIGQVLDELVRLDILVPHCDPAGWHVGGEARSTGISWVAAAMTAAADHCLAAAYRGECPGVDPDALMRWRVASRAAHQGRTEEEVLADVETARRMLRESAGSGGCPRCGGWGGCIGEMPPHGDDETCHAGPYRLADLRGESIPELPEAAAREGIPFLASVRDRDGREKVVLQCATPELVERFLAGELVPGLVDMYGDPARGFAGGYTSPAHV